MPRPDQNRFVRLIVPIALLGVGVVAAWAVLRGSAPPAAPGPSAPPSAQAPAPPDPSAQPAQAQPAEQPVAEPPPAAEQPSTAPDPAAASLGPLRARVGQPEPYSPLGDVDPRGGSGVRIEFSQTGAGIASMRLASEFQSVAASAAWRSTGAMNVADHVEIQAERTAAGQVATPFAALWAEVDSTPVFLVRPGVWRQTAPGSFEAVIETEQGEPVLRIERRFLLADGALDVLVAQRIENLSPTPRRVRLVGFGPVDLPQDAVTYGGDKRRVRFGYLHRPALDPGRDVVLAQKFLTPRSDVLSPRDDAATPRINPLTGKSFRPYATSRQVWPNQTSAESELTLAWAGMTNRYYAVAVHGPIDPSAPDPVRSFDSVETIERIVLQDDTQPGDGTLILRLTSPQMQIAPGAAADAGFRLYAGPLHEPTIRNIPAADAAGIEAIVTYNFGGLCAPCTFSWLTGPLLGLLRLFHGFLGDWSLAIVLLVFCVRGVLHPVNRWSQIRVQRFGKQMQDMAPKQKKIQEKFKDDRQRMQQEMAKLWREEGVNPAGMLGCLPMLLQSPIWIALYASLYFFYDLRHEPALFGVVQSLTNGSWLFLADLAEPDNLIPLPAALRVNIPLMGLISSVNILPLILAVVYYVHMKFLTPPTSATLTPEQEQTQKLAKWMTVIMFPVVMYNAPSGLAVYFIANSATAIIENTWIRRHIKKHNLLEVVKKPKAPRSGFMARLQQIAEQQQRLREQKLKGGAAPGPGGRGESAAQRAMRKGSHGGDSPGPKP